ncbi:Gfo/Idh/MocA family protein [Paenibacillus arenilitoris]|uniref:Gfo/Idh/MocA family oxidoreductase n=1 Tax=Paenibacillus arenilitoris TaxID=2772299 RepID=A0A927CLL4_9BACL|nr:Gfo/Idh/MocA family oxidoreductase [Paenibacillus arenilitoris]MBD2867880.1 Gfo/Idh/MocA family oxidoreductase [Paenibacillus arenilitoris]
MKPITVALIGAGLRGGVYTGYALHHPLDMKVVAVAEPDAERRVRLQRDHGIEDERCFEKWEDLLAGEAIADAVLICTQDKMHFEPTMRALAAGYHVLLEKPMSASYDECVQMQEQAEKHRRVLTICHVLRYTRFFQTLKDLLDDGVIGRLMSIQHNENVGYWHQAHSFVRGNWRNSGESSPMILAKSCHDLDILLWLAGADCTSLNSYGALSHFKADQAPEGAPLRCLDGCPAADDCAYYAPKVYLTSNPGWMDMAVSNDLSYEARYQALLTGPYGRCVYHCDNDVVDHQVVSMEFANEVTAVFTMTAFTEECSRTIKLMGAKGEIRGAMEKNEIEILHFGTGRRELITFTDQGGHAGHGGGDYGLMRDFVNVIRRNGSKDALTSAAKSVESHLMAFAAERSRLEKRVVRLDEFMKARA